MGHVRGVLVEVGADEIGGVLVNPVVTGVAPKLGAGWGWLSVELAGKIESQSRIQACQIDVTAIHESSSATLNACQSAIRYSSEISRAFRW